MILAIEAFVTGSGPAAMGYWDSTDIPFYYGLAQTFPVADRWFCSVMAQTYPNRRFLIAGTAAGIVSTSTASLLAPTPPNGTIFDRLDHHGITWRDYYTDLPSVAVIPSVLKNTSHNLAKTSQFITDAAAGKLPALSFVGPNFGHQSEEDPQDIRQGERFAAAIIDAAMHGPGWGKTLLIWTYDEHGGYYDRVPLRPSLTTFRPRSTFRPTFRADTTVTGFASRRSSSRRTRGRITCPTSSMTTRRS